MQFRSRATGAILEPKSAIATEQMLKHKEAYELIKEVKTEESKVADKVETIKPKKAPTRKTTK